MIGIFDAIVVGARSACAPTAILLARNGYRVLLLDRASFPSDTVSTHILHPLGAAALARWGPPRPPSGQRLPADSHRRRRLWPVHACRRTGHARGPGRLLPAPDYPGQASRRCAAEAGAEVREGFAVDEILFEDGRVAGVRGHSNQANFIERARIVVGADGWRSRVAETVRPEQYDERPRLLAGYYSYWSGLPMHGRFETYIRDRRGFAATPTHDDLTMVIVGWPYAEFAENRRGVEGNYLKTIALAPAFAERLGGARREARFAGAAVPNFFRKPYGPGWALVGDAGYTRDFITGQGIMDAFHDAELCAAGLDATLSGAQPFDAAMAHYQAARDSRVRAMYDFTCELATLDPPAPELQQLLAATHGTEPAMDAFAQMNAGTISPADFFAPENVAAITAAAKAPDALCSGVGAA